MAGIEEDGEDKLKEVKAEKGKCALLFFKEEFREVLGGHEVPPDGEAESR